MALLSPEFLCGWGARSLAARCRLSLLVSCLQTVPLGEGPDDGDLISSSVFPQGKFIRINFDVNGYIVGANIETCILVVNCKKCSGGGGSDLDGEEAAPQFLRFPFYWLLMTSRLWHQG